jgi:hypothetical protein
LQNFFADGRGEGHPISVINWKQDDEHRA